MQAQAYLLPAGVPSGWRLVSKEAVKHPSNPTIAGALIQNAKTGQFGIFSAGVLSSCPPDWAVEHADIYGRIKYLRTRRGMTQEQLAATIDVSPKTVKAWEAAARVPSSTALRVIANEFGVTVAWLRDGIPDAE